MDRFGLCDEGVPHLPTGPQEIPEICVTIRGPAPDDPGVEGFQGQGPSSGQGDEFPLVGTGEFGSTQVAEPGSSIGSYVAHHTDPCSVYPDGSVPGNICRRVHGPKSSAGNSCAALCLEADWLALVDTLGRDPVGIENLSYLIGGHNRCYGNCGYNFFTDFLPALVTGAGYRNGRPRPPVLSLLDPRSPIPFGGR